MIAFVLVLLLFAPQLLAQQVFAVRCAPCHGEDARGTAQGPGLAMNPRVAAAVPRAAARLSGARQSRRRHAVLRRPARRRSRDRSPNTCAASMRTPIFGPVTATEPTRKITWGAPQPGDWLTYNGNDSANRYSPLKQIDTANVVLAQVEMGLPHSLLRPRNALRSRPTACSMSRARIRSSPSTRSPAMALWHYSRPAQRRPGWRCQTRHQPRSRHPARQGLLRHRQRPPARARPRHRQAALGDSHGARRASALRRHGRAAHRQRYRHRGRRRRRSRHSRLRRRLQARYRRSGLAALDRARAAASPASKPGRARNPSPAAAPPGSPALTTRHPTRSTGPPAIPGPTATTATAPATTSTPTAFSRSTPRPANSNGTTNSRRTI